MVIMVPPPHHRQLREQLDDSVTVLEGALGIRRDFYVHTMRTLDLLAAEPCAANGETESSTAGLRVSANELHCQVRAHGTCVWASLQWLLAANLPGK